jgi:hypothetical protein
MGSDDAPNISMLRELKARWREYVTRRALKPLIVQYPAVQYRALRKWARQGTQTTHRWVRKIRCPH